MLLQIGDFEVLSSAAAAMAQRQSGGPNHFLLGLQAEVVDCVDLFFLILGVWSSACGTNALGSCAACRHGTRFVTMRCNRFVTISPKHHTPGRGNARARPGAQRRGAKSGQLNR
jgi:hypothetical protein